MSLNTNLQFPKHENLSHEQKSVTALRFDTNNLVIGAPGTGKTIVAMHRMNNLYEAGFKNCIMLVYNRPLMHYVKAVQKEMGWEDRFEIYTINDWVYYKLYSGSKEKPVVGGIKNKPVPNIDGDENKYKINWDEVNNDFGDDDEKLYEHIVVDEGQDININFYKLIVKLSKNVTIFMDPNQSVFEDAITIPELLKIINKNSYFTLTLNYRNSKKVADYTRKYAVDKSVFAESYNEGEDLEVLDYTEDKNIILKNILDIVKKYDNDKDIGIIVPSERNQNEDEKRELSNAIYDYLKENLNEEYKVSVYWNEAVNDGGNDRENVNFNEKSIKIFNYFTVRGIDFDVVILLDKMSSKICDENLVENKNDELNKYKNRLYIASTRAKLKLYIIPMDENDYNINDNTDEELKYSKFPVIKNMTGMDCYNKSIECYKNKNYEEAMYYLHYAISIVGLDDDIDIQIDAMRKMAFLCDRFNKSDFAIGMISNFAEKNKIYDDKKLIYYYQKCLVDLYNSKAIYDSPDNFFKNVDRLEDEIDKNDLIDKYFSKYLSKCEKDNVLPDTNFARKYIDKYNLSYMNSYKKFQKNVKEICEEIKNSEEESKNDEITESELWNEILSMKGHDLLKGSYILVIAHTTIAPNEFLKKAANFKYVEKDFRFYLDYNKMTNVDFGIEKYKDQPIAIIMGAMPHSVKYLDGYNSLHAKLKDDSTGYPKVFEVSMGKQMSVSSFNRVLEDVDNYIRRNKYDELAEFK